MSNENAIVQPAAETAKETSDQTRPSAEGAGRTPDQAQPPVEENEEISQEKAAEVLAKIDKESSFRKVSGNWARIVAWVAMVMSVYHLVTSSGLMTLPAMHHRSIHLAFLMALTFLLYPASGKRAKGAAPSVFDFIWLTLALASSLYIFFYFDAFSIRGRAITQDYIFGGIAIVCSLEATRRTVGKELMILSMVFLAYGFWGEYIPGVLGHTGFSLKRIIYQIFLSSEGIFGTALGVSSTYIFLFILFGAFLAETGMGEFIKDLAMCLAGRTIGGEAKVAIVSCGLMGTINGSAVGNVAATGTFTIPMMRSAGFSPIFSAGLVAAAGTGGMIMPPVMGSASFIMAEYLGVHYSQIMLAAAIPAVLYYISQYAFVHIEAKKLGMQITSRERVSSLKNVMRHQGYHTIPIIVIVYLLLIGRTPLYAAFYGIVSSVLVTLAVSFYKKTVKETLISFRRALESGARQCVSVGIACAVVGIIIGIVNLSGLGLVLGNSIVSLADGSILFTSILTMLVSIILGMGLPTTACYIITATIAAPALLTMDVNPLAAHMFCYYFACLSNLTPPVAIASYGAAGISGQNPSKVGWKGFSIALPGFVIPFTFIYSPALLFVNADMTSVAIASATAFIGVIAASAAMQGYIDRPMNIFLRLLLFAGACCLIFPGMITDAVGLVICGGIYLSQRLSGGAENKASAKEPG